MLFNFCTLNEGLTVFVWSLSGHLNLLFISFSGETDLLPLRFELQQPCRSSYDCLTSIPHSHCDYQLRVCTCQNYHVAYNNTVCLPGKMTFEKRIVYPSIYSFYVCMVYMSKYMTIVCMTTMKQLQ